MQYKYYSVGDSREEVQYMKMNENHVIFLLKYDNNSKLKEEERRK